MADALDEFKSLEERIARAIDVINTTRSEKETLARDLAAARREVRELQDQLDGLREQRKAVRGRVESLIASISELTEKRLV
jgi:chromosome segregation ATPase